MPNATTPDFTLDYAQQKIGAVSTPLETSNANTLLFDADPALAYALDFWSSMIRLYEGPRIIQAAAAAGLVWTDSVAQRYPWPPDLETQETQFTFPLLAAYRKDSKYEWKELSWERDRCEIDLVYILPPLMASQLEQIVPIFRAIEGTIRKATTRGFDPNYTPPGGTQGQQPWSAPFAGVEEIGFDRGHYGTWPGAAPLKFPFLHMEGYIIERDMYVQATNKLAGVDTTIGLLGADGTSVSPFVQMATALSPVTIASLSVATGPVTGGTSVTLTGTNFLNGPQFGIAQLSVMFGGYPAASVVWNSATSVIAVTPAMLGSGSVPVVLTNPDGRSAIAPVPFTFA